MNNLGPLETSKSKYDKNNLLNHFANMQVSYKDDIKIIRNIGTGPTCL